MRFHKFPPGKPTGKLYINFVAKDVHMSGAYKVDKNIPSKYKNLDYAHACRKLTGWL